MSDPTPVSFSDHGRGRDVAPYDPVDGAISTIWAAAMTVACNVVIMRQNDLNDDDGPMILLNEQGDIIAALKKWLYPDSIYLDGVRELLDPADVAALAAVRETDWKSLFETAHGALICIADAQADALYARRVADDLTNAALKLAGSSS